MIKKAIVFDSGALISFSMNGLLPELEKLKKIFNGKFLITPSVKKEIVDTPLNIKRFELEALMIQSLLNEGVLEMPASLGIDESLLFRRTSEILNLANSTFKSEGKEVHIIEIGEASCLALSEMLSEKGINNVIAIDERTTRSLGESPVELRNFLQMKMHSKIIGIEKNYSAFSKFKFIRSAELVYLLWKKKLIDLKGPQVLDALLYGVKLKGCAISDNEISQIKKMG